MKLFIICLILLMSANAVSQKENGTYAGIPDGLDSGAVAIYRSSKKEIDRVSESRMITKSSIAVTVLNKNGDDYGEFRLSYTNNDKVKSVTGRIYDWRGKLVTEIKKRDFTEFSSFQDFVFYSDQRSIVYSPKVTVYPYTVEYEYEMETSGIVHIDLWVPVPGYGLAVETALLSVKTPNNLRFRHIGQNYDFDTSVSGHDAATSVYLWQLKDFKAVTREPFAPDYMSIFPFVSVSPDNYYHSGYSATVSDWKSYGNWVNKLVEPVSILPPAAIQRVRQMTDTIPSAREKIKAVYQYMQQKTRYVAISEGIGGFQPMPVSDVDRFGYGDCKALSNYTRALLAAIDIPSYYTEIGAEERKIRFPDFASVDQTNHAILTVPVENDTLFLECTNPYNPFGFVGSSIANRTAVIITPDGGELINTKHYDAENSLLNERMRLKIDSDGNVAGSYLSEAKGLTYEEYGFLTVLPVDRQKEYLLTHTAINNLNIIDFKATNYGDEDPVARLTLDFNAGKYATLSGDRMFIPVNSLNNLKIRFRSKERINDIHFDYAKTESSEFIFELPVGYEVEHLPAERSIDTGYISYRYDCKLEDNRVIYSRSLSINSDKIPKEHYKELSEAVTEIGKSDNAKIILKRSL